MGLVMFIALFVGVKLAVTMSKNVLAKAGTAGSNLYVSVMFVIILTWVSWFMYRDIKRSAAGLFLAIFSGMQGAYLYAINGLVDLRITLLLYVGSLQGLIIGAVGTRVVRGSQIRLVMVCIIAMVAVSRAMMVPKYMADMKLLQLGSQAGKWVTTASNVFLYGSGLIGCALIIYWMFQAWQRARQVEAGAGHAGAVVEN